MGKKLIFLDVDGTLTEPGAIVPPESAAEAVRRARGAGHRAFLCTGRNRAMLKTLLADGYDGYIASAGGYVVCGDKVLFDCPMTDARRDEVIALMHENGGFVTLEAADATYDDEGIVDFLTSVGGGPESDIVRWHAKIKRDLDIRPMHEYDGRAVYKISFMCRDGEQLARMLPDLERDFRVVVQEAFSRGFINGELIDRAFDKGRGVRYVAEELGVPLSDTVGFGDSGNDLEMIETVGVGVCMANGSEELKRRSAMICPAVGENGIAEAFKRLGLV